MVRIPLQWIDGLERETLSSLSSALLSPGLHSTVELYPPRGHDKQFPGVCCSASPPRSCGTSLANWTTAGRIAGACIPGGERYPGGFRWLGVYSDVSWSLVGLLAATCLAMKGAAVTKHPGIVGGTPLLLRSRLFVYLEAVWLTYISKFNLGSANLYVFWAVWMRILFF